MPARPCRMGGRRRGVGGCSGNGRRKFPALVRNYVLYVLARVSPSPTLLRWLFLLVPRHSLPVMVLGLSFSVWSNSHTHAPSLSLATCRRTLLALWDIRMLLNRIDPHRLSITDAFCLTQYAYSYSYIPLLAAVAAPCIPHTLSLSSIHALLIDRMLSPSDILLYPYTKPDTTCDCTG